MKIYIICCFPAKSYIWEKSCSEIWAKVVSANQIPGFVSQPFLQKNLMKQCNSLDVDTNSQKLKVDQKVFGCDGQKCVWPIWSLDSKIDFISRMDRFFACWHKFTQSKRSLKIFWLSRVKNGCGQSGGRTLKLTLSEEWTYRINWFFACLYRFTKIKSWSKIFCVGMFKNRCGQSHHRTLKLTVYQIRTDGISWFFACWYKSREAKSWFNDFWVGMVKHGHGLLVHETLKSAVS